MKTKILKFMLAASIMLLSLAAKAQTGAEPSGLWSYSCPDAPYEYQTGKIEFSQANGKLMMKLYTGESSPANGYVVEKKGTSYVCNYVIDNYSVVITLARLNDTLSGIVLVDEWELPITLKPLPK